MPQVHGLTFRLVAIDVDEHQLVGLPPNHQRVAQRRANSPRSNDGDTPGLCEIIPTTCLYHRRQALQVSFFFRDDALDDLLVGLGDHVEQIVEK